MIMSKPGERSKRVQAHIAAIALPGQLGAKHTLRLNQGAIGKLHRNGARQDVQLVSLHICSTNKGVGGT